MIVPAPTRRVFGAAGNYRYRGMGARLVPVPGRKRAVRRGLRGLGDLDYYDLLAQANLQNCDPNDTVCVSNNVAKQAAVEDYWVSHMGSGVPDNTQLTFTSQTPQQVLEFDNPTNLVTGGNVVDTRGIMWTSAPETPVGPVTPPPPPPVVKPPANPPPVVNPPKAPATPTPSGPNAPAPGTQGGAPVINSNGATQPPPAAGSSTGFDFSSIPTWAWLAAVAGVALYAFGGQHGR